MAWAAAAIGAGLAALAIAFAWAVSSNARQLAAELSAAHRALALANQQVHASTLTIQTMERSYTVHSRGFRAEIERLRNDLRDCEQLLASHGGPELVLARLRKATSPRRSGDDIHPDPPDRVP